MTTKSLKGDHLSFDASLTSSTSYKCRQIVDRRYASCLTCRAGHLAVDIVSHRHKESSSCADRRLSSSTQQASMAIFLDQTECRYPLERRQSFLSGSDDPDASRDHFQPMQFIKQGLLAQRERIRRASFEHCRTYSIKPEINKITPHFQTEYPITPHFGSNNKSDFFNRDCPKSNDLIAKSEENQAHRNSAATGGSSPDHGFSVLSSPIACRPRDKLLRIYNKKTSVRSLQPVLRSLSKIGRIAQASTTDYMALAMVAIAALLMAIGLATPHL